MTKQVDVIIVNYRTASLAIKAAQSVFGDPAVNQAIIVDNDSGEQQQDQLRQFAANDLVKFIPSTENLGFGKANNLAAQQSTAPFLFLLNADAELFEGMLTQLVEQLSANPKLGIVAPEVFLPDQVTPQLDAQGVFPTPWRLLTQQTKEYHQSASPDWVSGVALMVRREEFLRLGGFNSQIFMYFEDVELCWQYRQVGQTVRIVPGVKVFHLGGASKSSTAAQKAQYYQAQDQYLRLTGAPWLLRQLVKVSRQMFLWYKKITHSF